MPRVRKLTTDARSGGPSVGVHPHTGEPLYIVPAEESPRPAPRRQLINLAKAAGHAAKSIAKTSMGIDVLPDDQVKARLDVCGQCPHARRRDDGSLHTCGPMLESMRRSGVGTCGCVLSKKARDAAEHCPFGWWTKTL